MPRTIARILPLFLIGCIVSTVAQAQAPASPVVATVDMSAAFQAYWKTREADAKLREQRDVYRAYVQEKEAQIKAMHAEFQRLQQPTTEDQLLTPSERDARRTEILTLQQEINGEIESLRGYSQEKMKALEKMQLSQRDELLKEIMVHVKKIAEEDRIDIIFDSSGLTYNRIPMVSYIKPDLDITARLKVRINEGHEDEVTDTRTPTAPAN